MKQKIVTFVIICFAFLGNICKGQVSQTASQFTVAVPNVIQHTPPSSTSSSSALPPVGSRIIWFEYGDGGFTSDALSVRMLANTTLKSTLLVSTLLYDTTRDNKRVSSQAALTTTGTRTINSDNDNNLLSSNTNVRITPNTYDIISRDTMCFAVSYKLNMSAIGSTAGKSFYLVFRYNTNVFNQLLQGGNNANNFTLNSQTSSSLQTVPVLRAYHGETRVALTNNLLAILPPFITSGSTELLIEKINPSQLTLADNNFFLSLTTKDTLVEGNTTSIDASIIQSIDSTATFTLVPSSTSSISSMAVRPSHDPNYITQSPLCMALPKTVREMKYHIHFQNTGRGPADIVRVTVNLPMGLNLSTADLKRAFFSGSEYTLGSQFNQIQMMPDQAGNKIVFTLRKTAVNNTLQGTDNVLNPAVNPETMGDIYFTVTATVNVPYTLVAQAFIDFHSQVRPNNVWETTVPTNIAVSNYSSCCNCNLFDCGGNEELFTGNTITLIKKLQ